MQQISCGTRACVTTITYHSLLAVVVFQLTEDDYRSSENDLRINAAVNKNLRIASPVVLFVTPYTVDQALAAGVPPLRDVPPDDNPSSSNRAKNDGMYL